MHARTAGFTLIELMISLAILALLASALWPMMQLEARREKERALRVALHDIRHALDAYKEASDQGHVETGLGASGYPRSLGELAAGVTDAKSPEHKRLFFLRQVPRDPFYADPQTPDEQTWGLRSYDSDPSHPVAGDDVYDIYSTASGTGLNGVPYRKW